MAQDISKKSGMKKVGEEGSQGTRMAGGEEGPGKVAGTLGEN